VNFFEVNNLILPAKYSDLGRVSNIISSAENTLFKWKIIPNYFQLKLKYKIP
jgi:hypothetical protein